jgi:hypothetical protein
MSKKKIRTVRPSVPPVAETTPPPKPSTILPFLDKNSLWLAIAVIALASLRIVSTYSDMGLTWDEPGHMACGLQYLAEGKYLYEAQHPPLARLASAFLPFAAGARPTHIKNQDQEGVNVMYYSGHPGTMLTQMRLGILPFFVLCASMVYLWARRYFGGAAAVLSTALFTLTPTVLAHAGLATTDMPLAGCFTAAFFVLLVWAEEPTWLHSILLGVATGLAVVSKFTVLGFLPVAAFFAALAWLAIARPGVDGTIAAVKTRALPFVAAVATGALVIWAVYSFSVGRPSGWSVSLPAPSLFEGVDFALHHNSKGHAAFFMGEVRNTGWWYFFPVLLLIKTPIAWLVLMIIGLGVCLARRSQLAYWMPVAFAAGILIPSMTSHVNIGLRHMLPIYSALAILAGVGLLRLIEEAPAKKWAAALAVALPLWLIVSGALKHPDYLAYFNEFAGANPERIVVDSDLDWGQDAIPLARRLKQLGANQVYFNTLNLGSNRLSVWPGLPQPRPIDPLKPGEGYTAVSPSFWAVRSRILEASTRNLRPWWTFLQPQERVGSLLLYYLPPGSIPPELR